MRAGPPGVRYQPLREGQLPSVCQDDRCYIVYQAHHLWIIDLVLDREAVVRVASDLADDLERGHDINEHVEANRRSDLGTQGRLLDTRTGVGDLAEDAGTLLWS